MAKSPPPLRHLYPRITSFPTLLAAYRKASKGKRYRPDVLAFAANLEAELFQLQHELRSFSYAPGSNRQFLVREPKPRLVSAAPFRDRVVHQALVVLRIRLAGLRLRLHPNKTHLHRTASRLRNHSLLRIRRGLRRCAQGLAHRRLRDAQAQASALSWNAHLAHGHTVQLRRRLFSPLGFCAGLVPTSPLG